MEFLRTYCMEHGERRVMERGETLEEAGEPTQWVAFVERGCFKYMVQMLSLKDIASFLNITPIYLSKLRREVTFGQK